MTPKDHLISEVKVIYKERLQRGYMGGDLVGRRAKAKRLYAEDLMRQGASHAAAWAEANATADSTYQQADQEQFLVQMGVAA